MPMMDSSAITSRHECNPITPKLQLSNPCGNNVIATRRQP